MALLRTRLPQLLVWLGFGIVFAILPILIICGLKLFHADLHQALQEGRKAVLQGDLLLLIAAILADSVGRLVLDIVRNRNPTPPAPPVRPPGLGYKVTFAIVLAAIAFACSIEYVGIFPDVQAHTQYNKQFVETSSWVFLALAFLLGFVVILMVEE